jgi:uncharacterized protein YukE
MADNVISSFLVSLGFKVNGAEEQKFVEAVRTATFQARLLGDALESAARTAFDALKQIAVSFEQLYYSSQRTGLTVQNIKALEFAAGQLGSTADSMRASLEAVGKHLRESPGYANLLKSLGVETKDGELTAKSINQLGDAFKRFKQNGQYYVGLAYANVLGISENDMRALISGEFGKAYDEYNRKVATLGLNAQKLSDDSKNFMNELRSLGATVSVILEQVASDFMQRFGGDFKDLNTYLEQHGKDIAAAIADIAGAALQVVEGLGKLALSFEEFEDQSDKAEGKSSKLSDKFKEVAKWVRETIEAFKDLDREFNASNIVKFLEKLLDLDTVTSMGNITMGDHPAPGSGDVGGWQGVKNKVGGWWNGAKKALGFGNDGDGDKTPIKSGSFTQKAPGVMERLKKDFGLTTEEAGAVLGNLGHESAGFTAFNEGGGGPGRGWAQWTDPGRKSRFFEYAQSHNLDPKSDEANYGFLKWELQNTHKGAITALKGATGLDNKMRAFEGVFEGAGVKAYGSRLKYANAAMAAYGNGSAFKPFTMPSFIGSATAAPANGNSPFGNLDNIRSQFGGAVIGGQGASNSTSNSFAPVQNTTINVTGSGDPMETAKAVNGAQTRLSGDLIRNMKGAVQ